MERWTIEKLKNTDDLLFAIEILYERRANLNPYAPLYGKISQAVLTLMKIRDEKEKFIARIAKETREAQNEET